MTTAKITYIGKDQVLENVLEIQNIDRCHETYDKDGQELVLTAGIPEDTSVLQALVGAQIMGIELKIDDEAATTISGYTSIRQINTIYYQSNVEGLRTTIYFNKK